MTAECPHCGQPMQTVLGVRFSRRQADILTMIMDVTKGRGGIGMDELIAVFYPGQPRQLAQKTLSTHINRINEMLVSTYYSIASDGGRPPTYRINKPQRQARDAAA